MGIHDVISHDYEHHFLQLLKTLFKKNKCFHTFIIFKLLIFFGIGNETLKTWLETAMRLNRTSGPSPLGAVPVLLRLQVHILYLVP